MVAMTRKTGPDRFRRGILDHSARCFATAHTNPKRQRGRTLQATRTRSILNALALANASDWFPLAKVFRQTNHVASRLVGVARLLVSCDVGTQSPR